MRQETEKILQATPFNTYDDLFFAVYNNKASIRLSNNACRQIAQTQKPLFTNWGIHFGIIPSAIITIALSIYSANYYLLFLLLLEIIFPFAIYFFNNFKIKTGGIAAAVVLCDLFFIKLPLFVLIVALSWIICSWVVNWWGKKVYTISIKILQYDEEAFEWAYNSHNLLIEDCYGNIYSKLQQTNPKIDPYERLLKILRIGAGAENVDDAITLFSSFYNKKGINIPNELYSGINTLSYQQKCENLLKILELGIGIDGIDNIAEKLIEYYRSKGIAFPEKL